MGRRHSFVVIATSALLVVIVAIPIAKLFSVAAEEISNVGTLDGWALWNTMWSSLVVTILALAGGLGAAFATERTMVPGRRWIRLGMLLPLLVPPFVSALSWARAYGPGGLLDDLMGWAVPSVFGPVGVVVVMAVNVMPVSYLLSMSALATRSTPELERAGRVSGSSAWGAFRTISLPLLGRAIIGSSALIFVLAINAFGVPAVLGIPSGFRTITTRIYQDLAFSSAPASFARAVILASILIMIALVVVGIAEQMTGGLKSLIRPATPAEPVRSPSRRGWIGTVSLTLYLVISSIVPLVSLVLSAVVKAVGLAPTPNNWTSANFAEALSPRSGAAAGRTLLLAILAATIVLALGGLLVWAARGRFSRWLGTGVLATFAVPGSTLAVGILLAYGGWLRDTMLLILIAYLAKFWAIGHRTLAGSADSVPIDLRHAARISGADPGTGFRTVLLPIMRPAIASAWIVVSLFAAHELTMSSLLYGPGTDTLAVVVLNLQQLGDTTVTSALAVMLTLPPLIIAVVAVVASSRKSRIVG